MYPNKHTHTQTQIPPFPIEDDMCKCELIYIFSRNVLNQFVEPTSISGVPKSAINGSTLRSPGGKVSSFFEAHPQPPETIMNSDTSRGA